MEQFFDDQRTLKLLSQGMFAPFLETFANQLSQRGYARLSVRAQIRLAACFGRWLTQNRVSLGQLTSKHAALYMQYRKEQPRDMKGVPATLERFLRLLREKGVIAEEISCIPTIAQKLTDEFVSYLRDERGLGRNAISSYRNHVSRFLDEYLSGSVVDLSSLCASDIVGFVQRRAAVFQPATSKHVTAGLRAFLQFARYQGYISADLSSAVPRVANWSMASVPRGLPRDQVALVLSSSYRRQTAVGRRDYAILLLLARLGLRAGEVASLAIEDINWHDGQITVQAKCSRRLLPLPSDVGEALVAYLKDGRPQTKKRALFLSGTAPVCEIRGQTVARVVQQALLRAGIHNAASQGAHQFRHSLATQLLAQDASLAEIGQLLGHRKIDTTAIYAKVDIAALRTLALLWPGGAQ